MEPGIANTVEANCPLCDSPLLSVARSGRVVTFDMRAIALGNEFGRGYMLCNDCWVLADLPAGLTLN
jgi:hypothetical protein